MIIPEIYENYYFIPFDMPFLLIGFQLPNLFHGILEVATLCFSFVNSVGSPSSHGLFGRAGLFTFEIEKRHFRTNSKYCAFYLIKNIFIFDEY